MKYEILENEYNKVLRSDVCNYIFNKENGNVACWGKDKEDDPDMSIFGPFIADIELSTICHGPKGIPCKFCYKGNTGKGHFMSFETYKEVFSRFNKVLQQVAFGIGDCSYDESLWQILKYTRDNGVIPNITINGNATKDELDKLANVTGAVAVSLYDKDLTYDCVKYLSDIAVAKTGTIRQCNIHCLLSANTIDKCLEVLDDTRTDPRLKNLNAVVFLHLKKKGSRNTYEYPTNEQYKNVIEHALKNDVRFGMDSCQCNKFMELTKDHPMSNTFKTMAEPCESFLFSTYISADAKVYPCSFCDGEKGWTEGINVLDYKNYDELWNSDRVKEWRTLLLGKKRSCPIFEI